MSQGYIKLHRSIRDNFLWKSEPFTKAQAWVDLLLSANHADGGFFIRGIWVGVKRGQVARSELTLAKDWKWSRMKIRRFLNYLCKHSMIEKKQDNKTTIISIIKYDTYQMSETTSETASETAERHQKDTKRDTNNNVKNVKNEKNKEYPPRFLTLWNDYPNSTGSKSQTLKNWTATKKKKGMSDAEIYQACMNSAKKQEAESKTKDVFYYQLSNLLGQKYRDDLPNLVDYEPTQARDFTNHKNPMPKEFL